MSTDAPPPEIPEAFTMRRGDDDDHDAVVAMEAAAYDEDSLGEQTTRTQLEDAAWLGVLEQDGEPVAYAINDHASRAQARILSAAVDPEHRGGQLQVEYLNSTCRKFDAAVRSLKKLCYDNPVRQGTPQGARKR